MLWGLTRLDDRNAKPTYADVAKGDICLYPKVGEARFVNQIRITTQAKFLEPPGRDASSSRCHSSPLQGVVWT